MLTLLPTSCSFTELPSNPSPRQGAFSGLTTSADGSRRVVSAGGYPFDKETWFLELDGGDEPTWSQGPDFPAPAYRCGADTKVTLTNFFF